jgi:hypothetical protein
MRTVSDSPRRVGMPSGFTHMDGLVAISNVYVLVLATAFTRRVGHRRQMNNREIIITMLPIQLVERCVS